jgi:hypothetical protein
VSSDDFETYWADIRPKPYPQTAFRWPEPSRFGRGIEELAKRLDVEPEVLSQPDSPRTGPRTVSAWFQGSSEQATPLVSHGRAYSLQLLNGHIVYEDGDSRVGTVPTFNDGLWHHVVVSDGTIYVDGALVEVVETIPASGVEPEPAPESFSLSDVAIWDRELTSDEAQAIYNGREPKRSTTAGSPMLGPWRTTLLGGGACQRVREQSCQASRS